MAANLGQSLMGGSGVIPSLAQELAAGNFNDSRESFHDYIYSKLILGEDKEGTGNPVFPTMPNYAPTSMGPPPPRPTAIYHNQNNMSGGDNSAGSIPSPPVPPNMNANVNANANMTIPSAPHVSTLKPGNSKKAGGKSNTIKNLGNVEINVPDHEGIMNKKKKSHKKKEKTNFCDVCGRGFAEKYTLNRHMMTHTHVKPYACTKCNMAFSRSDGLAKHMNAGHRRIDAHHCDVCGGTFNSEVSFEQHRREYGSTLPFVCNLCMLAFSQCCHLNYHMKSHSLKSDYGVDVDTSQPDPVDVDGLIPEDFELPKNVTREPTNKIASLSSLMAFNSSLNPDIHIKHEVDEEGNSYGSLNNSGSNKEISPAAVGHEKNSDPSSGHSPVATTTGSPTGFAKENLAAGTNAANPISDLDMKKYFDIKVPNPKFMEGLIAGAQSSASSAATPGTEGGQDSLFRCQLCGKGFTRKYHMQRHVRLHTRGPIPRAHLLDWTRRPYACGVCKMGFTRQHHLTRHMLIHTGERPHSCHICGKAFRRFTNLSLHVRTVHGSERPFKCPICSRGFPRVYSLQRHLNTHGKNSDANTLAKAGLLSLSSKTSLLNDTINLTKGDNEESFVGSSESNPRALVDKVTDSNGGSQERLLSVKAKADNNKLPGQFNQQRQQQMQPQQQHQQHQHQLHQTQQQHQTHQQQHASQQQQQQQQHTSQHQQQQPQHHHHQQQPQQQKVKNSGSKASHKNKNKERNSHPQFSSTSQSHQQQSGLVSMAGLNNDHNSMVPQSMISQHQSNDGIQHQQQQQQQQQLHQQPQQGLAQDVERFSSQVILANTIGRPDMSLAARAGFGNLAVRSSSHYPSSAHHHHHQSNSNGNNNSGDRSNTPFTMNQPENSSNSFSLHPSQVSGSTNSVAANDRSNTPYGLAPPSQNSLSGGGGRGDGSNKSTPSSSAFTLNSHNQTQPNSNSTASDRSSTPYSHSQQQQPQTHQQASLDRSTTPFMLNQAQGGGAAVDAFTIAAAAAAAHQQQSSRPQSQQMISSPLDRSDPSRDTGAIVYSHATPNGFQLPMGATMDLSAPRGRLAEQTLRQIPDFGHNLTMSQAALNEAAAFAHLQAANNLPLFPGNPGLSYQQQLMGEALSRLDIEVQAAQQQGHLPVTSHNNSSNNRQY